LADMKAHGIDTEDTEAVGIRNNQKYHDFFRKTHDLIKQHKPDATLYYNGTTRTYNDENISLFKYNFQGYNTKHDLEDLPTAWGEYCPDRALHQREQIGHRRHCTNVT